MITYQDCADALLKMWMDNVLTDAEYNRIMDKLNNTLHKTEPQTINKSPTCVGCIYDKLPNAFHPCASCVDFSKFKPQTERSE